MADAGKEADLAAIKARFEFNYALVDSEPTIAADPLVGAAVANCKASHAAFVQAVADADAARQFTGLKAFRIWGADKRVREMCAAADQAFRGLRFAIEQAEARESVR
jgi:hypothetical protein